MLRRKIIWLVILMFLTSTTVVLGAHGEIKNTGRTNTKDTIIWIYNVYDLQNMSKNLSGHYALANDIDASITRTWNNESGFKPIGNSTAPFNGTFDGKGHKIINLWINRSSQNYVGLFGYTSNGAQINNVGLVNITVRGHDDVGGLVGWNYNGTINNSYVTGEVRGNDGVGGIAGTNGYGLTSPQSTVNNSYAKVNVSGKWDVVGGLVGLNEGIVNNSHASGNVWGSSFYVGGLVGDNNGGTVRNSYAVCNVSSTDNFVGGLVGLNEGVVEESYFIGNVKGYNIEVGGLVGGDSYGTVKNSYSKGSVNGFEHIGGLVGGTYETTVKNSYSACIVKGSSYVGGLIGYDIGGSVVTHSFWDINVSGVDHSVGGRGKTTEEMMNKTTFTSAGWDFINIWDIWNGRTYPFFRWQNVTTVPAAPTNLVARAGDKYVNLTWNTPADNGGSKITEYKVYRNGYPLATVPVTQLWINDTGVVNGQTYVYYITAVNSNGEGLKSEAISATPLAIPTAPQNLQATAGDGKVTLSWDAPSDDGGRVDKYNIYRGLSPKMETYITSVNGTITTYINSYVTNGLTYYYYVTAVNDAGESEGSNEVHATPLGKPSPPQQLTATGGDGYVQLNWNIPKDDGGAPIIEYKIYRGTKAGNETLIATVDNSTTTYNDTSVKNGVRYYYYVTAVNEIGESDRSNEVSVLPLCIPSPPRNLTAYTGNGYVNLSWEEPPNCSIITEYRIYRNGTLIASVSADQLWYNDTNVKNDVTYTYYITAINLAGESEYSNVVHATPIVERNKSLFSNVGISPWVWVLIALIGIGIGAGTALVLYRKRVSSNIREKQK